MDVIRCTSMCYLGYRKVIDPILRGVRAHVPGFAGMRAGDSVLDICCGTGEQALLYGRGGMTAVGIDLDPLMILLAQSKGRKVDMTGVWFQIADAERLPFRDSVFDYASVSFALHEKERAARDRVISEAGRVVKDAGALVLIDFRAPYPGNLFSYMIKAVEFLAGGDHFRCSRDYTARGGLDALLGGSGLREERREHLMWGNVAMVKARKT